MDFLPLKCSLCNKTFCQLHYKPSNSNTDTDHQCQEYHNAIDRKAITCPLCLQVIPVSRNQDPNVAVEAHVSRNCPKEKGTASPSLNNYKCGVVGCHKKEIIWVTCEKCSNKFCIKHRLEPDHKCQGKKNSSRYFNKNDCRIT